MRQFEGADVALTATFRSVSDLMEGRHAPQGGSTLEIRGKASGGHSDGGLRLLVGDGGALPPRGDGEGPPPGVVVGAPDDGAAPLVARLPRLA